MIFHRKNVAMKQEVKTSRKNEPQTPSLGTIPRGHFFPYNAKTPTGGRECLRFSYEGEIVIVSKRLRELFHH